MKKTIKNTIEAKMNEILLQLRKISNNKKLIKDFRDLNDLNEELHDFFINRSKN